MRRLLTLALSLTVAGMGPVPLSWCAILSSKLAECSTPKTESACDKMDMRDVGPTLVAPNTACCGADNAPVAARQRQLAQPVPTMLPAVTIPFAAILPTIAATWPAVERYLSPPPLRSLLCTFLI
jgi:hypothetical protein